MSSAGAIRATAVAAALDGFAEHGERYTLEQCIDRFPGRAFAMLSVLYLIVVATLSSFKLLWLDELITLHIARLGSAAAIWHALAQGADPNPPVTHLLVLLFRNVFGDHEFAYRLPAVAGYWIGLLSLFLYLKKYLSSTWALGGTVLSMTMAAFDYSYESRSYGIFYGLAMLAFFCWSRAIDPLRARRARRLALAGMTFALAAGISTNYFAVLAFLPIAAGELVRTLACFTRIRRGSAHPAIACLLHALDIRIWLAMAVAATPLLAYRPLIARSIAQFAPYAWNKVSLGQVFDSYTEMVEVVLYPIVALFIVALVVYGCARFCASLCRECRSRLCPGWLAPVFRQVGSRIPLPTHELAAVLFLMLYPFLGYVVASIRGGMLSPRFVIPVCFGFAIAATLAAWQLFGRLPRAATVFLCFVIAWFVCREAWVGYWYEEQKQCFYKILDRLPQAEKDAPTNAPIVIPDPLLALTFQHYAPPAVAARVVFPVDFPAIRFYRHDDSPEENLWAGRKLLYSMPIVPLATYQKSAGNYLIVASDGNWLLDDLSHHRYGVRRLPIDTRAGAIGGFTPLARGTPSFYTAEGEGAADDVSSSHPIPFRVRDNLPSAQSFSPDGEPE